VGGPRLAEAGVIVDLPAGIAGPPSIRDVSYVLADMDSGEILAAKAPHVWLRPASTLKTLTALTLIPRLDRKSVVIATKEHQQAIGTRVGILAGNRYPVGSLFDAMLMFSANDAAYALADAAGGYDETLALMNETAASIGAYDTVAKDPSGLDEEGQHSSAYDLALIGRAAMAIPSFRRYITKTDAIFPGGTAKDTGKKYKSFHVYNINELLPHYPGAIGIKPGRTNRAQHTFIGAATREGRTLIVTQMGSTTGDWEDTAALLDWGFANAATVLPVGQLVEPGEARPPVPAPTTTVPVETPSQASSASTSATTPPAAMGAGRSELGDGQGPADTAAALMKGAVGLLGVGVIGLAWITLARRNRSQG
jgi:D-alanyl-D-alanine carboxypeptidase (penicillin-binding protein 5/6)